MGSLEKKWAQDDNRALSSLLASIDQRLVANDELLNTELAAITSKIDRAIMLVEAIVCCSVNDDAVLVYVCVHLEVGLGARPSAMTSAAKH